MTRYAPRVKRLLVVAVCLLAAACSTSAPPTTSAPASTPTDDAQAIRAVFETCTKGALAKDGAAVVPLLMGNAFKVYDQIRKEALTATEETIVALRPSGRLLAYTMRAELDPALLRSASPKELVKAIIDKGLVGEDSIRDIALGKVRVNNGTSLAEVLVGGREVEAVFFAFGREDGTWKFDMPALFDIADPALHEAGKQQNLTLDQLFDQVLTVKYGPAKAADVRKPIGA